MHDIAYRVQLKWAQGAIVGNFIVLIDDNVDDEMLTIRALKKNNVTA